MRTHVELRTTRWLWHREPSRLTQVCIMTDATVPRDFEQQLSTRLGNAPQVAWLHLSDPAVTHGEWLTSREQAQHHARSPEDPLEQAIDPLPRDSRLLLCSEDLAGLEWLGGVLGQQVFFAHYRPEAEPETQLDAIIATVEEVLRASLTEKWGDSY
ncbi:hypothetical protein P3T43_004108 [Paraburkholderia sp. GAS41]|jgi:hypothetical protein|uniref:hypothetical protein n=1 Tax=Paraburkholderia sp. GAS41 TaxID=3035134 RepID=UPI003D1BA52D